MRANAGDVLRFTGRRVGTPEHRATVIEMLGPGGGPPYRVEYADGRQTEIFPGSGCLVEAGGADLTAPPRVG
ncbi:DUF1918 domain-containing protein [Streptomyces mirabilis]